MKVKYYCDAGHGWYAVKRDVLSDLGIYDKITTYSYQRGQTVYLEEDCDADALFTALKEQDIEFEVVDKSLDKLGRWPDRSPIRSYDHFRRMGV